MERQKLAEQLAAAEVGIRAAQARGDGAAVERFKLEVEALEARAWTLLWPGARARGGRAAAGHGGRVEVVWFTRSAGARRDEGAESLQVAQFDEASSRHDPRDPTR